MTHSCRCARQALASLLLPLIGLLSAGAVQAFPATWEFKGTIVQADVPDIPADLAPGTPFRIVVSFDTAEPISAIGTYTNPATGAVGHQYRYFGPRSLKFTIFAGTSCNPCVPSDDQGFDPSNNGMNVRDNYPGDTGPGTPTVVSDGMSFGTVTPDGLNLGVILRDEATAFTPQIVTVNPTNPPLPFPVEPDSRLPSMRLAVFQACNSSGQCLFADLESVDVPTFGAYFFLSSRHCLYPDRNVNGFNFGDDCIVSGVGGQNQPLVVTSGGSAGRTEFSETVTHVFATPSTSDAADAVDYLGTIFAEATFGGPSALPVIRGSSFPSQLSRSNANVLAYQQYVWDDPDPLPLWLVVDVNYEMQSVWQDGSQNYPITSAWPAPRTIEEGLRPGGATALGVLSVIDGTKVPPAAMAALQNFNTLTCGAEAEINPATDQYFHQLPDGSPWPPGSIMGMSVNRSLESAQGEFSATFDVLACDGSDVGLDLVTIAPGQRFYLAEAMQTPARGLQKQDGTPGAVSNGFVDASDTFRVVPDPAAPPEILQAMAQGLKPSCSDCGFEPELQIDVKPGSADNAINASGKGVVPVALLGSDRFDVHDVDLPTLRLGALQLRSGGKSTAGCSFMDVNGDGVTDLMCQFENASSNWQEGQTIVTLTGHLENGETLFASDSIRLVP